MILAIDIGNTNVTCGVAKNTVITKVFKISTSLVLSEDISAISRLRRLERLDISNIVICSVVPSVTKKLVIILKKIFRIKPLIIGRDLSVPLRNLYKNPKAVGQDRLIGAYAGSTLYGYPLVIIDFGTAITFDVVSPKREYLGGVIVPGIQLSLNSLHEKTALLPMVKFKNPPFSVIGKNTTDSILNGIFYGYASLCDGVIKKIKEEIGPCRVIATGGHCQIMKKYCTRIDNIEKNLILKGIVRVYADYYKT
jgi:type III pantothenate kinase